MEQQFVNRISETEYITKLIEQKNRVNIIFSNEGFGKTILIEHLLKQIDKDMYININTDNLLSNDPCDFYFIKKLFQLLMNNYPLIHLYVLNQKKYGIIISLTCHFL